MNRLILDVNPTHPRSRLICSTWTLHELLKPCWTPRSKVSCFNVTPWKWQRQWQRQGTLPQSRMLRQLVATRHTHMHALPPRGHRSGNLDSCNVHRGKGHETARQNESFQVGVRNSIMLRSNRQTLKDYILTWGKHCVKSR